MTTPSLPAIRERAEAWQEEQTAAAARGLKWTGPPEVPGLREEVAFLLALVADLQERMQVTQAENRRVWEDTESLRGERERLQGERDGLRATLEKTTNCLGKCAMWLPHEDKRRRTQRVMSAARKALAALPADACVACTYDRGAKVQLCAACAARAALGEE